MTPTTARSTADAHRTTLTRRGFTALVGAAAPLAAAGTAVAAPGTGKGDGKGKGKGRGRGKGKGRGRGCDRDTEQLIEEALAEMSIEQKIGQLFVPFVYGSTIDEPSEHNVTATGVETIEEIIRTYHVGGIIYFGWSKNLEDPHQIATLSDAANEVALEEDGAPLLISTDEERGVVTRLPAPATPTPGNMGLGATGSTKHAAEMARITGEELRVCGIAQPYAPILDVNVDARNPVIGVRSFGANPQAVSLLGVAQIEAFQQANVSASVKHFPGHGDTAVDSHVGLPVIEHTREEIDELDLPPFHAAIRAGVDAIMTAHIVVPALDDSGRPATLSRPILTGLLREEMGFEGVIVTDSLSMEGVRTMFDDDRVPVEAILAGADQMLMPPDLAVAVAGVRDAVAAGEITEERLDESVRRILAQKAKRGLFEDPWARHDEIDRTIGSRRNIRAAERAADDAVTLLTNDGGVPLAKRSTVLVTGAGGSAAETLAAELRELTIDASAVVLEEIDETSSQLVAEAAEGVQTVIVLTSSSSFKTADAQVAVVEAARESGADVINVSIRNPYDVVHVGPVAAAIAAYAGTSTVLRSVARVLVGRHHPSGTLPVAIPEADGTGEAFPLGHGLRG